MGTTITPDWDRDRSDATYADAEDAYDFLVPPAWHPKAACRTAPLSLSWFPERGDPVDKALAVCAGCPVTEECLADAERWGPGVPGVWGGTTEAERKRRRKSEKAA